VREIKKEKFGLRTIRAGVRTQYAGSSAYLNESLMLTGDLNVAVVPWIVQYRIKDPYNYLFKVKDVNATLRDLAEAAMRLVVGDRSINGVISKREEIADQAKVLLQKELDEAETSLNVVTIEMKKGFIWAPKADLTTQQNKAATGNIAHAEQQSLFWQVIAWSKDRQNLQNHDDCYQQGGEQAESSPPACKEEKSGSCQEQAQAQPPDSLDSHTNRSRPYFMFAVGVVVPDEIGGIALGRDQAYPDRSHGRTQGVVCLGGCHPH
jgi:hypothetical protein